MKKIAYKFAVAMIMMVAVSLVALSILANTIMQISVRSQNFMNHEVKEIDTTLFRSRTICRFTRRCMPT